MGAGAGADGPGGEGEELLCPSARCEPGAILLGVVGPGGRVSYLRPGLEVDDAFVEKARAGRAPEKRFRFAQPCVEDGCRHWSEGRCGVAEAAVSGGEEGPGERLPACTIRPACRWYAQEGGTACRSCATVITDVTGSSKWNRRPSA